MGATSPEPTLRFPLVFWLGLDLVGCQTPIRLKSKFKPAKGKLNLMGTCGCGHKGRNVLTESGGKDIAAFENIVNKCLLNWLGEGVAVGELEFHISAKTKSIRGTCQGKQLVLVLE